MKGIYLLLGSNLGYRVGHLDQAIALLSERCGTVVERSSIYESAPWGDEDQPAFLNQVIELDTELDPQSLLDKLLQIELDMGRVRFKKWGERMIDIDVLYYGSQLLESPNLIIPHPEIQNRRFTLLPMTELNPDLIHPGLHKDQVRLLEECPDPLWVFRYDMVQS